LAAVTRYEAYISKNWDGASLAFVFVTRSREDGRSDLAGFLVDSYCLGVKDALFDENLGEGEANEFVKERLPDDLRERIHPACAKKLIEGAVAYAESLGFSPHRDYRKARRILSGIDAALCPREFAYGCEGRPRYVRGMDDDEARVERVCGILEAKFGPEGFDYEDSEADEEDDLADRAELMEFLEQEKPEVPRFYEFSGLVTAMLLAPGQPSPGELSTVLWPGDTRVWRDNNEVQGFLNLLQSYWNQVNDLILAAVDPTSPADLQIIDIWSVDFPEGPDGGLPLTAASIAWAKGFLRAKEIWPDAWGDALTRSDLAPHWEVIGWWAEFDLPENRDRVVAHAEAEPKRTLNLSVIALARALREPLPPSASA
jgi:hypothetical protein